MLQNPGTIISGGVARQISGGTGQPSVWATASSGVAGIDALYTAAGANLADGDIGITNTNVTPRVFYYSSTIKNWIRVNPLNSANTTYFTDDGKCYGFRLEDATTVGWSDDGSDYTYSAPYHTFTASGATARVSTDALAQSMDEIGCIIIYKMIVATGATSTPIFDLRRNLSGTNYNLRLQVSGGFWQLLNGASVISTGIAYAQNTEYSFEVYYNYNTSRAWVYHNFGATPTSISNSPVTLPTTGGTKAGLALQNNSGVLTMEGFGLGHLRTQL